jgi:hypothetical protein
MSFNILTAVPIGNSAEEGNGHNALNIVEQNVVAIFRNLA